MTIITSSDSKFFPLLEDMLLSLEDSKVVVIDDGLTREQVEKLSSRIRVIKADQFLEEFYPGVELSDPAALSCLVRTLLPVIDLEADVLTWVDADVWFQDSSSILDYEIAANHGDIAITPEVGPLVSYVNAHDSHESFHGDLLVYYGEDVADKFSRYPILNAGVFSMRSSSPLWESWREEFGRVLKMASNIFHFGMDQVSLNYAILSRGHSFNPMPYVYNYSARLVTTMINGELRTNAYPFEKIKTVHLLGDSKWGKGLIIDRDESGTIRGTRRTSLRRSEINVNSNKN